MITSDHEACVCSRKRESGHEEKHKKSIEQVSTVNRERHMRSQTRREKQNQSPGTGMDYLHNRSRRSEQEEDEEEGNKTGSEDANRSQKDKTNSYLVV